MAKTYTFRLTSEGVSELKTQLDQLGPAGVASFQKIIDAAPGLGSAMDNAAKKAEQAHARLVAATTADFQGLQAALDPAIAAQQNFAKGRDVITAAQTAGAATDAEAASAMALLEQRYGSATAGVSLFSKATGDATRLLGAFGIALSIEGLVSFGKGVFDTTAGLKSQAAVVGVSIDALEAYRAATSTVGLTAGDTDAIIQRFTRSMGDATAAIGPARTAFHDLNLGAADLAGGTGSTLPKVAAALLAIQDPAQRARDEVALFGKSGQEIEPALRILAEGLGSLEQQARDTGQAFGTDLAEKADAASKRITESMQQLKVSAAPAVVFLSDTLSVAVTWMTKLADIATHLGDSKVWGQMAEASLGLPVTGLNNNGGQNPAQAAPTGDYNPSGMAAAYGISASGQTFGQQQFNQYLAGLAEATRLTGLSKTERAAELEVIKASVEKQKDEGVAADAINNTYAFGVTELGAQTTAHVRNLGIIGEQNTASEKLKETFDKYVLSLQEEARIAGEAPAQREAELAVIKAAQIVQTQQGIEAKNLVQTYAQALPVLGQHKTAIVEAGVALKQNTAFAKELTDQQTVANAALSANVDDRELAVQIAQKEVELGRQLTDIEKDRLKTIQATNDAANLKQGIEDLKEQVQLAGMLPDQAEQYRTVLQAVHASHGNITDDQKTEIAQLVQQQQEAQKLGQLVSGIQGDWATFIDNFLEKRQLNFSSLLSDWKRTFAQWLSQMTAQAIAQPIVIPMVEELVGSVGGTAGAAASILGGAGGSSSSGGLGLLSNASSLGNLFGGDSLGIGSAVNGLGSALGFSTALPALDLGSVGGISLGSVSTGVMDTSGLFGATTLGGFLGGAGIGSLAGSLLFGNKNDAGLGSMGGAALGAALGSIVPGIGTIVGGLLGGVLGGGLGSLTGSSNQGAWVDLLNGGANFAVTQQGSSQNTASVTQVAQSLTQAVQALQAAGVSITNNIKSLEVGGNKDVLETNDGTKQNLPANDPDSLLNAALNSLLSTASATDADIQKVIQTYQGQGGITSSNLSQFLSDIGFANSIKDITFGDQQLSQVAQALAAINSQFADAIQKAQALGLDTTLLESAKQHAIDSIVDQFNTSITTGIQQLTDPIAATMAALVTAQKARLDDANTLGIDTADVLKLNATESQNALQQYLQPLQDLANNGLSDFDQQMNAINKAVSDATDAAQALGLSLDDVNAAAAAARSAVQAQADAQAAAAAAQAAQAGDSAKSSLSSLVNDLTSGSDSALSPSAKYFNLLQQYTAAARAAQGSPNDPTAIGNFQSAAQALLPTAREFLGSSQAYGALSNSILSTATQIGGDLADPSGVGRAMIQAQTAGSSAIVTAIGDTNSRLDDLSDKFSRLTAQMQAIINRAAA